MNLKLTKVKRGFRVEPTLLYCDLCDRSEVDDIITANNNDPTTPIPRLIQMTTTKDGLTLCERCANAERSE